MHDSPNQGPYFSKLPDISVLQGSNLSFNLSTSAYDPEGDILTYSVVNSSIAFLSIDNSNLQIEGIEKGTEQICIDVSDQRSSSTGCLRLFVEDNNESILKNNEVTNTTITLQMKVQFYDNSTNNWLDDNFTKNLEIRIGPGSSNLIKLSQIFDQWDPLESIYTQQSFTTGLFRVLIVATNDNQMLYDRNQNPIISTYNFSIVNPSEPIGIKQIPEQFILENEIPNTPMLNLIEFADTNIDYNSIRFEILNQTNPNLINCNISNISLFTCSTPTLDQVGSNNITLRVTDGIFDDTAEFSVTIIPLLDFDNISVSIICTPPFNLNCQWQTQPEDLGLYSTVVTAFFGNSSDLQEVFVRILPRDSDEDGIDDDEDACPLTLGRPEFQGCLVGDENLVELHVIDRIGTYCGGAGSCKNPIQGAEVRVFDRQNTTFQSNFTMNPSGTLYAEVFEANIARVGRCTTNLTGRCIAGENQTGVYLVITKYYDILTNKTIYTGKPKGFEDFNDTNGDQQGDLAFKDFQIIKVLNRDGSVDYKGGSKTVIVGSILEIIHPQYVVWEDNVTLYPFILTSDSNWTLDMCIQVPQGYEVVNGTCLQTIVANETKEVIFTVVEVGSPDPNIQITFQARHGRGPVQNRNVDIPGKRSRAYQHRRDQERNNQGGGPP